MEQGPGQTLQGRAGGLDLRAPHLRSWWDSLRGAPEQHSNLDALHVPGETKQLVPREKRIIICADGTWNVPPGTKAGDEAPTNVWLLYQLIKDVGNDGMPQLKYYHAGVGTVGDWVRRVVDGATGGGLAWNMVDCYQFLVDHYNPGDHVYLFGFSRGAYTVRTLAGLIRNSGIVKRDGIDATASRQRIKDAYALYRDRTDETTPVAARAVDFRAANSHPDFHIACIGVWDTVGALGVPATRFSPIAWLNDKYRFHDVTLSAYVDAAFHAMAIDERRGPFTPTLWIQQPQAAESRQVMEQVWFPGVHSDVGGGYLWPERGLANETFEWMIDRVMSTCFLTIDVGPYRARSGVAEQRLHDSMSLLYKALNAIRITSPLVRVIDAGLGNLGVRDAARATAESMYPPAERRVATPFPGMRQGWDPANVKSYFERRKRIRETPTPVGFRDRRQPQANP